MDARKAREAQLRELEEFASQAAVTSDAVFREAVYAYQELYNKLDTPRNDHIRIGATPIAPKTWTRTTGVAAYPSINKVLEMRRLRQQSTNFSNITEGRNNYSDNSTNLPIITKKHDTVKSSHATIKSPHHTVPTLHTAKTSNGEKKTPNSTELTTNKVSARPLSSKDLPSKKQQGAIDRQIQAAGIIQRAYRRHSEIIKRKMLEKTAAVTIQRVWRGWHTRMHLRTSPLVHKLRQNKLALRHRSLTHMSYAWKRWQCFIADHQDIRKWWRARMHQLITCWGNPNNSMVGSLIPHFKKNFPVTRIIFSEGKYAMAAAFHNCLKCFKGFRLIN